MSKYYYLRKLIAIVEEKQKLRDEASQEASIAHNHWDQYPDATTLAARDTTYEAFQEAIRKHDRAVDTMRRWVDVEDLVELLDAHAALNTPSTSDFLPSVALEAVHQQARWGAAHDAQKGPEDWFWLLGYLGGKALRAAVEGDLTKALHHTISTAAACAHWHAALVKERGE